MPDQTGLSVAQSLYVVNTMMRVRVLMSVVLSRTYRLSQNVRPLIWVECTVEKHSRSRTEYLVKARSQFKERSSASNVEIFLPLPQDAITPTVRASQV